MNFRNYLAQYGIKLQNKDGEPFLLRSLTEDLECGVISLATGVKSIQSVDNFTVVPFGVPGTVTLLNLPQLKASNYKPGELTFIVTVRKDAIMLSKIVVDLLKTLKVSKFSFGYYNDSFFILPDDSGEFEVKELSAGDFSEVLSTMFENEELESVTFESGRKFHVTQDFTPVLNLSIIDMRYNSERKKKPTWRKILPNPFEREVEMEHEELHEDEMPEI